MRRAMGPTMGFRRYFLSSPRTSQLSKHYTENGLNNDYVIRIRKFLWGVTEIKKLPVEL